MFYLYEILMFYLCEKNYIERALQLASRSTTKNFRFRICTVKFSDTDVFFLFRICTLQLGQCKVTVMRKVTVSEQSTVQILKPVWCEYLVSIPVLYQ